MPRKVTRSMVARQAGVSQPVVSYVLNGQARERRISEPTIARVLKTARELGYQPSIWGRLLKTQRSNLIALVSQDLTDPNTGELIKALGAAVRGRDIGLVLLDLAGRENLTDADLKTIETSMADALLLHMPSGPAASLCADGRLAGKPVCVIGRALDGKKLPPSVETDNAAGAELAVRHLLERGARRIGVVGDCRAFPFTQSRLKGAKNAAAGISVTTTFRESGEDPFDAGRRILRAWIAKRTLPDGLFAMGDILACGVLAGLSEAGIPCPERVKVVGFDGTPSASYTTPSLTTVAQPFSDLAETALSAIQALLAGDVPLPRHPLLTPVLQIHASTGGN